MCVERMCVECNGEMCMWSDGRMCVECDVEDVWRVMGKDGSVSDGCVWSVMGNGVECDGEMCVKSDESQIMQGGHLLCGIRANSDTHSHLTLS